MEEFSGPFKFQFVVQPIAFPFLKERTWNEKEKSSQAYRTLEPGHATMKKTDTNLSKEGQNPRKFSMCSKPEVFVWLFFYFINNTRKVFL